MDGNDNLPVGGAANDEKEPPGLPRPYYQNSRVVLYHGNMRSILPLLEREPGRRIHVVTDPPYSKHTQDNSRGISTGKKRASDGSNIITGEYKREFPWKPLSRSLLNFSAHEFARLVTGWCLVFSDDWLDGVWRRQMMEEGLLAIRRCYFRKTQGAPLIRGDRPACWTESIECAHAKDKKMWWNGGGKANDYPYAREASAANPSVKPLALMKQLLSDFTDPGDLVIDPFAGTGTTLLAAQELGRYAIGIERDRRQCDLIAARLRQTVLPFTDETPLRVKFRSQQASLEGVVG